MITDAALMKTSLSVNYQQYLSYVGDVADIFRTEVFSPEEQLKYERFLSLSEVDRFLFILSVYESPQRMSQALGISRACLNYKLKRIRAIIDGTKTYTRNGKKIAI